MWSTLSVEDVISDLLRLIPMDTLLSPEVLQMIFLHLNHEDLAVMMLVCKFWAGVAGRPKLWTDLR